MNTAIFCTSFIDGENSLRYKKWIDYYLDKMEMLGANHLFLIDDGSPEIPFANDVEVINATSLPQSLKSKISLFRFDNHLGRPGRRDYPGWWRSFTFAAKLAQKYQIDKIIHIESDFYVLSPKMMDYMAKISNGWTVFYSVFYDFPETAIQVICQDSLDNLNQVYKKAVDSNYKFRKIAERILPFTKIEKGFCGDRLGEIKVLKGWIGKYGFPQELDFLGQINENDDPEVYERFFRLHL